MTVLWLLILCAVSAYAPAPAPSSAPLITKETYVDGYGNFPPQDLDENNWNKSQNTSDYTLGDSKGQPIHIAQINLVSPRVQLQHVSLLCKLSTADTHASITAAAIHSIGAYAGGVTIRSHDAHTFIWTSQALHQSHGFNFNVDFWGKPDTNYQPGVPPYVYCANPRAISSHIPPSTGPGK